MAALIASCFAGCGISLDLDPQSPPPISGDFDAAGRDGGRPPRRDAGVGVDDGGPADDANAVVIDASVRDAGSDGGAPDCLERPCSFVPVQCGCPDGDTCYAGLSGPACRPVGPHDRNAECTDDSQCALGLTCVVTPVLAVTEPGVCAPYCTDAAECGGGGSVCELVDTTATGLQWGFCTTDCDPVTPMGECPATQGCDYDPYVVGGTFCRNPSGGGAGSPCTGVYPFECVTGTICASDVVGPLPHCRKLCWTGADCASSETCVPLGTVGGVSIGYCQPIG